MRHIERVNPLRCNATVMELVDMTDSKSVAFGRGGSSPPSGTKFEEAAIY